MGKQWKQWKTLFWGVHKITADGDCSHEIKRHLLLRRKVMTNLRQHIKKQRQYFTNKGPSGQSYGFSSSHVQMWELDYKESWGPKNWGFWTVVLERTLESPLGSKEIQPVYPKGNQSWRFIGRTDAEAEVPILWPPDAKGWLIRKGPDARKDSRQEEEGMTEDETVGWHHQFDEDGWMASPTRWTWVWASTRRWWRPGKLDLLQSLGSQRVRHDWVTEQQTKKYQISSHCCCQRGKLTGYVPTKNIWRIWVLINLSIKKIEI